jgi:hypothetical protein
MAGIQKQPPVETPKRMHKLSQKRWRGRVKIRVCAEKHKHKNIQEGLGFCIE